MKFAVRTTMAVAFLWMLFAPVQAAEVDFTFLETKWSTPTKDLKGFSKCPTRPAAKPRTT